MHALGFVIILATLSFGEGLRGAQSAEPSAAVRIFRCETLAGPVFADRPCGEDSRQVALGAAAVSSYTPVPTKHAVVSARKRADIATARRPPALDALPPSDCTQLRARIARIDARMRQGYSGRTGEHLRAERRVATRDLVDRNCR